MDPSAKSKSNKALLSPTTRGFLAASAFNFAVILLLNAYGHHWDFPRSSSGADGDIGRDPRKMLTLGGGSISSSSAIASYKPGAPGGPPSLDSLPPAEVWARGTRGASEQVASAVKAHLKDTELTELRQICGRCLYHSLTGYVTALGIGGPTFVATGDIPEMWIRDSSVQMGIYLPHIPQHPLLRNLIEGTLRTQAYFILTDPWANSFTRKWRKPVSITRFERLIGRGGWVGSRNFELDSGAYFMSFLWNYYVSGLYRPDIFLAEPIIHDAVLRMIDVYIIEQRHEELSPYRYSELPRDGLGKPVKYTGMVWSGFRPSDDANFYGYNIPANMYAAGALERMLELNSLVWKDDYLAEKALQLALDIRTGIEAHGIVTAADGSRIYAYEVDGLGNSLHSTDDPNLPSLLAVPLLGYKHYDKELYASTRKVLYSSANKWYYKGTQLSGLGSTHTPTGNIWPLAHMVEGLLQEDPVGKAEVFRQLLKMQGDNGLMHESVNVNSPHSLSRPIFEWANAMFVTLYENTFGENCDAVAEELRLEAVLKREAANAGGDRPRNSGKDIGRYFELLEFDVVHEAH